MDVDGKNVFMGHTQLFKQATEPTQTGPVQQKVVVANEKNETKLVILKGDGNLMEELKDGCIRKFQVKKKKGIVKFTTQKGEPIDSNESLQKALDQKDQIVFRVT